MALAVSQRSRCRRDQPLGPQIDPGTLASSLTGIRQFLSGVVGGSLLGPAIDKRDPTFAKLSHRS